MTSSVLDPAQLARGTPVIRLLKVEFAGQTFLFADKTCDITSSEGVLPHSGHAAIDDVTVSLGGLGALSEPPSVGVSASDSILLEMVRAGHALDGSPAEVSLILDGSDYESRVVIIAGQVSGSAWGSDSDGLTFSVAGAAWDTSAQTHDSGWVISSATWPSPPTGAVGAAYPIVFGGPGRYLRSNGSYIAAYGSTAAPVTTAYAVVTVGHAAGDPDTLYSVEGGDFSASTHVIRTLDAVGTPVTLVDFGAAAAPSDYYESADPLLVDWGAGGSGVPSPLRPGGCQDLRDVLAWMLSRTSHGCDLARTLGCTPLGRYRVAGFVDESCGIMEWLSAHVLTMFPVALVLGPGGAYPVPIPWGDRADDAVAALTAGEAGVARVGTLETTTRAEDVRTEVSLKYAWTPQSEQFVLHQIARAATMWSSSSVAAHTYSTSPQVVEAAARYGRVATDLESILIYDNSTATLALQSLAWRMSRPQKEVSYSASWAWAWVQLGQVVTLTDEALGMDSAQAAVKGISYGRTGVVFRLALL